MGLLLKQPLGSWGPRLGTWDRGHGLCHRYYTQPLGLGMEIGDFRMRSLWGHGTWGVWLATWALSPSGFHGHKRSAFDWHKRTSTLRLHLHEIQKSTNPSCGALSKIRLHSPPCQSIAAAGNDGMVADAMALLLCVGPAIFGKQGHGYVHLPGAWRVLVAAKRVILRGFQNCARKYFMNSAHALSLFIMMWLSVLGWNLRHHQHWWWYNVWLGLDLRFPSFSMALQLGRPPKFCLLAYYHALDSVYIASTCSNWKADTAFFNIRFPSFTCAQDSTAHKGTSCISTMAQPNQSSPAQLCKRRSAENEGRQDYPHTYHFTMSWDMYHVIVRVQCK